MANTEDNEILEYNVIPIPPHLYMWYLLARYGPEANLCVFLLKAQMMLTAKTPS